MFQCTSTVTPLFGSTTDPRVSTRLIQAHSIRLSEILAAMSTALDITQGHPEGHCMRSALIGMRLADQIHLPSADASALFYSLLLKDLGCSSNAAKMSYLFGADDHLVKRSARLIDWTKPGECLKHCWTHCATGASTIEKLLKVASVVRLGKKGTQELGEIRCERGAEIARLLQMPEATVQAIRHLDEHWNGGGAPYGLKGDEISLPGRICCLAQTVEVFFTTYGLDAAIDVACQRRGEWFDPGLVDALVSFQHEVPFWNRLLSEDLVLELSRWEPEDAILMAGEECLDRVAEAFAKVVDAKSPWTYQHSTRVADIATGVAQQFDCTPEVLRDVRRAALLHDVGKLGVSNLILDKPGRPTDDEFDQIKRHPEYSQRILEKVDAFRTLAHVASGHHERLDGRGYHRGLAGAEIAWITRVLTVADICEAMSAKRPYRNEMPWERIRDSMARDEGLGVDPECLRALVAWHEGTPLESRVDAQLSEVDRLLSSI